MIYTGNEKAIRDKIINVLFEDCKLMAQAAPIADKLMKVPSIRASQDMYEALKNLIERIDKGLALGETADLSPARNALAKAEGKE
jgi:hypothetical protein